MSMNLRVTSPGVILPALVSLTLALPAYGQAGAETFTATATVKTAAGGTASAPAVITVTRKMSQKEAQTLTAAFKTGGAAALRKALEGVAPTGSVQLGTGQATPTRLTIERSTGAGRLLTIVTDKPILFLGAGMPGAKAKEGYDFAVIDIEVNAQGTGTGTLAPAARIRLNQDAFVVEDYASELVRLVDVKVKKSS
jgi:hypothetical protein